MKRIDMHELSHEPGEVADQIAKGERFALTYRGRVIAELRRSCSEFETAADLEQVLLQADTLREQISQFMQQSGVLAEDSTETLRSLRDNHARDGVH